MTKQTKYIIGGVGMLALVILIGLAVKKTPQGEVVARVIDQKPDITFTWLPEQPYDLREFYGKVRITDDHGINFTSYKMTIVDIDRTIGYPVEGLIGKEWEQPISFSLIADDPRLFGRESITVKISVADDMGQTSEIEKVITFAKK